MGFWEILALVLTGAGTLASILGIFFAIYAKQNGKVTREFVAKIITEESKATRELLAKMDRTLEKISEQIERIPEKTAILLK